MPLTHATNYAGLQDIDHFFANVKSERPSIANLLP